MQNGNLQNTDFTSYWIPYWVILLTNFSGTNYVPNEHEDADQYGSFWT